MRTSSLILTALTALPLAVSAKGTLGFALGSVRTDGSCKSTSDYAADFEALSPYSKLVRTYAASQCNQSEAILPAATAAGFQVLLGVWPEANVTLSTNAAYQSDKAALQASIPGNEGAVFGITVGSEVLYRNDLTAPELLDMINDIQSTFSDILVGTADSWNKYADGTADPLIKGGVKLLLGNAFSFWQNQAINNATATYFNDMQAAIGHIQDLSGSLDSIRVMNGETGWPTDGGSNYGAAIAGTSNAAQFWKEGVCGMLDWGVDVFYFEAFDEPSKADAIGQDGTAANEQHWGALNADRSTKFDMSC